VEQKKNRAPSALDPANDVPTEPECVRRVAQPALRALEHRALVDQAVEHLPPLRQEFVQPRLCAMYKRVLVQCVRLPARTQVRVRAAVVSTEGVLRRRVVLR